MRAGISLVVMALTVMAGFFLMPAIHAWQEAQTALPPPTCLTSTTPCIIKDKTVQLSVDTMTPLTPARLTVAWPSEAESLQLRLVGHEMDMGEVRIQLNATTPGVYVAEVILPVCTLDAMTWHGELTDGNESIYTGIRMQR